MPEENTEARNVGHMNGYAAAVKALRAAFAAYQVWQEDAGDWGTFVDWVEDEDPDLGVPRTPLRRGEMDEDDPAEAPAVDRLGDDEECARCGKQWIEHTLETMPPKREDCAGFECSTDHDADGSECPLRCGPCRRCTECEGEEHHWMVILGDAESDGDHITIPCKHCSATTHGVDCEACGEIVPAATSHLCVEDDTWLCADCTVEVAPSVQT